MTYLLDTNVISETVRPVPNINVMTWLDAVDEDRVFLSVITFAEIREGIERLPEGQRRQRLADWLADELPARFEGRVIVVERQIAETWGQMMVRSRRLGANLSAMDAFFAATAEARHLILVTHNMQDFAKLGIPLLDPWNTRP
ncbi:MAG TPA: type II toxin-antitoxin system VapC family toxin [Dehalococcoidia bacterium]|nr:type II toxin-antitoxin system VapC family toxin [Dehalococcoidia bacterium]